MQRPPRNQDDHLISWKILALSYGTIGMMETVSGFFAFFYLFQDNGFSMSDLAGTGVDFKKSWGDLDDDAQDMFRTLCEDNEYYQTNYPDDNCTTDFTSWRQKLLRIA